MSGESVLSLREVGVCYGQKRGIWGEPFWALRDVSLVLRRGETLGVIGRNGVGKSTLLRLMAGIIRPDRGVLVNEGVQVSLLSLQVGFVYYLTGRENALLSGMLMGLRRKEVLDRMEAICAFSELGEFFDRPIATYSTGMVARLAFSVAFQVDPEVLLVDEILGVGDAEFSQKSARVMHERMLSNRTVVFVSHHAELVRHLCDRVVWIEGGVSRAEGETEKVLREYYDFLHVAV